MCGLDHVWISTWLAPTAVGAPGVRSVGLGSAIIHAARAWVLDYEYGKV
jgi:hypothetical protein